MKKKEFTLTIPNNTRHLTRTLSIPILMQEALLRYSTVKVAVTEEPKGREPEEVYKLIYEKDRSGKLIREKFRRTTGAEKGRYQFLPKFTIEKQFKYERKPNWEVLMMRLSEVFRMIGDYSEGWKTAYSATLAKIWLAGMAILCQEIAANCYSAQLWKLAADSYMLPSLSERTRIRKRWLSTRGDSKEWKLNTRFSDKYVNIRVKNAPPGFGVDLASGDTKLKLNTKMSVSDLLRENKFFMRAVGWNDNSRFIGIRSGKLWDSFRCSVLFKLDNFSLIGTKSGLGLSAISNKPPYAGTPVALHRSFITDFRFYSVNIPHFRGRTTRFLLGIHQKGFRVVIFEKGLRKRLSTTLGIYKEKLEMGKLSKEEYKSKVRKSTLKYARKIKSFVEKTKEFLKTKNISNREKFVVCSTVPRDFLLTRDQLKEYALSGIKMSRVRNATEDYLVRFNGMPLAFSKNFMDKLRLSITSPVSVASKRAKKGGGFGKFSTSTGSSFVFRSEPSTGDLREEILKSEEKIPLAIQLFGKYSDSLVSSGKSDVWAIIKAIERVGSELGISPGVIEEALSEFSGGDFI